MSCSSSAIRSDALILGKGNATMRVLIAAPRKSGSSRLRCLVAAAYGLEPLGSRDVPDWREKAAITAWLGSLPDDVVVQTNYPHSVGLSELASHLDVALVGVLRHPYDLFVAIYEVAQRRERRGKTGPGLPDTWEELKGRLIDGDDVLAFLADGFANEIAWLRGWHDSGAPLVRFEQLESDPAATLTTLGIDLGPLPGDRIARALAGCDQADVIYRHPQQGRRMADIQAGAWRERLSDAHLAILRGRYATAIADLGYEAF
jgi:hypothetical protein